MFLDACSMMFDSGIVRTIGYESASIPHSNSVLGNLADSENLESEQV
jgi:hypothetical protein